MIADILMCVIGFAIGYFQCWLRFRNEPEVRFRPLDVPRIFYLPPPDRQDVTKMTIEELINE